MKICYECGEGFETEGAICGDCLGALIAKRLNNNKNNQKGTFQRGNYESDNIFSGIFAFLSLFLM